MRIGIDVRPAVENVAGIGKHTLNLVRHLLRIDAANEYILFSTEALQLGSARPRVQTIVRPTPGLVSRLLWHARTARDVRRFCDRYVAVGSLQVASMTHDCSVLILPDVSHVVLRHLHTARSRIAAAVALRKALRRARWIIAASAFSRDEILKYADRWIDPSKVKIAHIAYDEFYGIAPTAAESSLVQRKYSIDFPYILYVGTIEPRKNLPRLIAAFEMIARFRPDLRLLLAGQLGWQFRQTLEAARTSPISDRIIFLGYVPDCDLPALYASAMVFVYPSLYEGFGLPPLEAMTCGTPVVTSNTSSLPEVVGDAAVTVDPTDIDALAAAVERILDDRGFAERLSAEGRERARMFSWDRSARLVLETLEA